MRLPVIFLTALVFMYLTATAQGTGYSKVTKLLEMKGVCQDVDKMPKFLGSDLDFFSNWLGRSVIYPREALGRNIQGTVVVAFIVEKNGKIQHSEIIESPDPTLSWEVEIVLKGSPALNPAQKNGKKVRSCIAVVVFFEIYNGIPIVAGSKEQLEALRNLADKKWKKPMDEDEMPILDVSPTFRGGDLGTFREWVNSQIIYPVEAIKQRIQGSVTAVFIVEKDGAIKEVDISYSSHPIFSQEVMRVLRRSPKWTPGISDG